MPKKKSSRPAASLSSSQNEELKSSSQIRRERIIRMGAIGIVLALLLSLMAGAFSITPTQAANFSNVTLISQSVQINQVTTETVDTDGDGIENNEDPDVDGDGLVNGEDPDIDGDGIENFEDADPIDTTDIDSKAPEKPIRPVGATAVEVQASAWIFTSLTTIALVGLLVWRSSKRGRK